MPVTQLKTRATMPRVVNLGNISMEIRARKRGGRGGEHGCLPSWEWSRGLILAAEVQKVDLVAGSVAFGCNIGFLTGLEMRGRG
jgi:hypothetical protein